PALHLTSPLAARQPTSAASCVVRGPAGVQLRTRHPTLPHEQAVARDRPHGAHTTGTFLHVVAQHERHFRAAGATRVQLPEQFGVTNEAPVAQLEQALSVGPHRAAHHTPADSAIPTREVAYTRDRHAEPQQDEHAVTEQTAMGWDAHDFRSRLKA